MAEIQMEVKAEIFTRDKFWEPIIYTCKDEVFSEKKSSLRTKQWGNSTFSD